MAATFPLALLQVGEFHAALLGSDETGGAALAGVGQVIDWSTGGLWAIELGGLTLWEPDHFLTYRALLLACRGGGEIDLPIIDWPNRPMDGQGGGGVPFSDGALFDDGTGFDGSRLDYELAEPMREGDVTAVLRRKVGRACRGGEYWTIDHPEAGPRAYAIEQLSSEDETGRFEVAFGAPCREDSAAGAAADFETPRVRCRLLTPWSEAWPRVTPPFEATCALRFIESFNHL